MVKYHPVHHPICDIAPIHCFDYKHVSEHGLTEGIPNAFDAAQVPEGEHLKVTYINLV